MIFDKSRDSEEERRKALEARSEVSGQGASATGAPASQAPSGARPLEAAFTSQAALGQANQGTLTRQLTGAKGQLEQMATDARRATDNVSIPFQSLPGVGGYQLPGLDKLGTTPLRETGAQSFAGDTPSTKTGSSKLAPVAEGGTYEGPADVKGANGYVDAVQRISAWQGMGDDAQATGTQGDVLNQGLLGIAPRGATGQLRAPSLAQTRAAGDDVEPAWAAKQAGLTDAIKDFKARLYARNAQAKDWNTYVGERAESDKTSAARTETFAQAASMMPDALVKELAPLFELEGGNWDDQASGVPGGSFDLFGTATPERQLIVEAVTYLSPQERGELLLAARAGNRAEALRYLEVAKARRAAGRKPYAAPTQGLGAAGNSGVGGRS